jgi:hypothetical protein
MKGINIVNVLPRRGNALNCSGLSWPSKNSTPELNETAPDGDVALMPEPGAVHPPPPPLEMAAERMTERRMTTRPTTGLGHT